jgi:hypothetical protein
MSEKVFRIANDVDDSDDSDDSDDQSTNQLRSFGVVGPMATLFQVSVIQKAESPTGSVSKSVLSVGTNIGWALYTGFTAVYSGIVDVTPTIISVATETASIVAGVTVRAIGPVIPPLFRGSGAVIEGVGEGVNLSLSFIGDKFEEGFNSIVRAEKTTIPPEINA